MDKNLKKIALRSAAMAGVFAVLIGINAAVSAEKPVFNEKLKVVTAGYYRYNDRYNTAKIAIPKIVNGKTMSGVAEVNKDVGTYTDSLITEFHNNMVNPEPDSGMPPGFHSMETSWEVIANSPAWFTLKITTLEIMASGNNFYKIYNIDKSTGKYVPLNSLFKDGSDYIGIISENIKQQMIYRMDTDDNIVYWVTGENAFKAIKPDQNYFFNKDIGLVIVFNEYEVAPGSMGTPEFVIPNDVIADILKV